MNIKHISFSIATSLIICPFAFAEVPTVGNTLQNLQIPKQPKAPINTNYAPISQLAGDENATVFVKSFRFIGNKFISTQELEAITEPYINKNLNMSQIRKITDAINKKYRDNGSQIGVAIAKENAYNNGVLTITIVRATSKQDDILAFTTPPSDAKTVDDASQAGMQTQKDESGKTVFVKDYKFVGNVSIDSRILEGVVAEQTNKNLTFTQISDVADAVTKYYREKGYFVAVAFIAKNAYSNETVTITIVEGVYGKIKLDNSSLASDATIDGIMQDLHDKQIDAKSIERAVLLADDLAGVDVVSVDIMPGSNTGESDFLIKTVATPRFDGYLTADNYGSIYTGIYRYTLGANANSPFGIGDKLSITGMITDGNGLKNGSINYGAPIMSNGLYLSGGYYNTQYSLGNDYSNLDAVGNTSALQAILSYPVIKSKTENLSFSINPQMQLLSDKQLSDNTQKRAGLAVLSADYSNIIDFLSAVNSVKANAGYTFGNLSFKSPQAAAYDSVTTNTQGNFNKLSASVTTSTPLTEALSFKNVFNAQYALGHKNLDGSQDISIGGAYAVRAFPSTQESGDSGYIYSAELSHWLPSFAEYNHNIFIFYDVGRAFMTNSQTSSGRTIPFNAQILQDTGIGYSLYYNKLFAKFQFAQVVGGVQVQGVSYYNSKGLFQVGVMW